MGNYIKKLITVIVIIPYISRCFHKKKLKRKKKDVHENDVVEWGQFLEIEELHNHNRDKTT